VKGHLNYYAITDNAQQLQRQNAVGLGKKLG